MKQKCVLTLTRRPNHHTQHYNETSKLRFEAVASSSSFEVAEKEAGKEAEEEAEEEAERGKRGERERW